MRLENVFYGFTKEGKRRLLLKKSITEYTEFGNVTRIMYYDLENREYFEPNVVDESTLVGVVRLVGDYKRKSKRKVINAYKADCNLLYDVTGAFYGDIIYKIKTDKIVDSYGKRNLFVRISDPVGRVQNINNGSLYHCSHRIKKGFCVQEVRPIKKDLFSKNIVKKKTLLEADYRKLI